MRGQILVSLKDGRRWVYVEGAELLVSTVRFGDLLGIWAFVGRTGVAFRRYCEPKGEVEMPEELAAKLCTLAHYKRAVFEGIEEVMTNAAASHTLGKVNLPKLLEETRHFEKEIGLDPESTNAIAEEVEALITKANGLH